MKIIIKNIIVIIIILANFAFMSGLVVNHHFCRSSNSQTQSIYYQAGCNHIHHKEISSKEEADIPECCKTTSNNTQNLSCDNDDESCCENILEIFSINDDYTISKLDFQFQNDFIIIENVESTKTDLVEQNLNKSHKKQFLNIENSSQNYNIKYIQSHSVPYC